MVSIQGFSNYGSRAAGWCHGAPHGWTGHLSHICLVGRSVLGSFGGLKMHQKHSKMPLMELPHRLFLRHFGSSGECESPATATPRPLSSTGGRCQRLEAGAGGQRLLLPIGWALNSHNSGSLCDIQPKCGMWT